ATARAPARTFPASRPAPLPCPGPPAALPAALDPGLGTAWRRAFALPSTDLPAASPLPSATTRGVGALPGAAAGTRLSAGFTEPSAAPFPWAVLRSRIVGAAAFFRTAGFADFP